MQLSTGNVWRPKFATCFTLLEILIVIAIIGVLAALILSATILSRKKVQETACASNLRQIGVAFRIYVQDNDGIWPTEFRHLDVVQMRALKCPTAPESIDSLSGFPKRPPTGYEYNVALTHDFVENGLEDISRSNPLPDSRITFPATTVAVCDANLEGTDMVTLAGPDICRYIAPCPTVGMEQGFLRHNGGGNYLFSDGHIKWYKPAAVGYAFEAMNDNSVACKDGAVQCENYYNYGNRPTFAVRTRSTR